MSGSAGSGLGHRFSDTTAKNSIEIILCGRNA